MKKAFKEIKEFLFGYSRFIYQKLKGVLEDVKDENNSVEEMHDDDVNSNLPRKGISVSIQVPTMADRAPVLVPCSPGNGGLQGLNWHTRLLKMDEDGDVADEFLEEVIPLHEFQVKLTAKSPKLQGPFLSKEGTVEFQQLV